MSAGYSHKPLIDKLGYETRENICLIRPPAWFKAYLDSSSITTTVKPPFEWVHIFCENEQQLAEFCQNFDLGSITTGIWVSWPKKSSSIVSDLSEQSFRDYILPLGWVDVKVVALDETWSGLKFLRRKATA